MSIAAKTGEEVSGRSREGTLLSSGLRHGTGPFLCVPILSRHRNGGRKALWRRRDPNGAEGPEGEEEKRSNGSGNENEQNGGVSGNNRKPERKNGFERDKRAISAAFRTAKSDNDDYGVIGVIEVVDIDRRHLFSAVDALSLRLFAAHMGEALEGWLHRKLHLIAHAYLGSISQSLKHRALLSSSWRRWKERSHVAARRRLAIENQRMGVDMAVASEKVGRLISVQKMITSLVLSSSLPALPSGVGRKDGARDSRDVSSTLLAESDSGAQNNVPLHRHAHGGALSIHTLMSKASAIFSSVCSCEYALLYLIDVRDKVMWTRLGDGATAERLAVSTVQESTLKASAMRSQTVITKDAWGELMSFFLWGKE